jgi:spermidine synthase
MVSASTPFTLTRAARFLVLVCFLTSGACGLTYEIVWVRQLTLVAGATTPAVSIVLAVFMGGLALGARIFGALADRSRNPLKLYAWLELGIAGYGLLQPALLDAAGSGYVAFARQAGLSTTALMGARLAVAAVVLLVPCILMGGTLPVLARFLGRSRERFGLDLGTLYAVNLAGAVAGSVLTGFVLVRHLGLRGTIVAAVLGNVAVGLAAFLYSARVEMVRRDDQPPAEPRAPMVSQHLRRVLWALAGFSGFATMGYQVTWTRMLSFGFDSTVYAFTVILITFLFGLSIGSLAFARLDGRVHGARLLLAAHLLGGITALLLAPMAARQPELLAAATARFGLTGAGQLAGMGLGAVAVMLLPTALMGMVFPLVGRLLVDDLGHVGQQLGRAYGINTAGAILGSLLTGFVLIPAWSLKGCLLGLAIAQAVAGLLLLPWCARTWRYRVGLGLTAAAALFVTALGFESLLPGLSPFDRLDDDARFVAHRDDMTASVSVVETTSGVRALRINGFNAASNDAGANYMPMMSHLPLLLHPRPQRELVICFGTGATAGAALLHPGVRVDVVDINRAVFNFATWFERENHGVFRNPRARLIHDDGRNHLLTTHETYDVITSEPMPPTHAGVVSLYSREYYLLARRRLAPGGLLVQWLPLHLLEVDEALAIVNTVRSVFPETTLWLHSTTGLIVARADGPVRMDWSRLRRAWQEPTLAAELADLGIHDPLAFTQLFLAGSETVAQWAAPGGVISDDLPTLEFHPPRHKLHFSLGGDTLASVQTLASILASASHDRVPLDGSNAEELQRCQTAFEARTARQHADLQLLLGDPLSALLLYQDALRLTSLEARPGILLGMARAERAARHPEEARRLVAEVLAVDPANTAALVLSRELEGGSPPSETSPSHP